jgi:hypothetical protein
MVVPTATIICLWDNPRVAKGRSISRRKLRQDNGLKTGRLIAIKLRIVATEELALEPVRLKRDVPGYPFSLDLQKFPQTI